MTDELTRDALRDFLATGLSAMRASPFWSQPERDAVEGFTELMCDHFGIEKPQPTAIRNLGRTA